MTGKLSALSLAMLIVGCGDNGDISSLPVADAGADREVAIGDELRLDGRGSSDPDGAELSYDWSLATRPAGSAAELLAASTAQPRITLDAEGTYLVALVVDNGKRESQPDVVMLRAVSSYVPVVAEAECFDSMCSVLQGQQAQLDGRDSAGGPGAVLSYDWEQVLTSGDCAATCPEIAACAPLADPVLWLQPDEDTALSPFQAPCQPGPLVFSLVVSDGSSSDTACVEFDSLNVDPVAAVTVLPGPVDTSGPQYTVDDTATFTLAGTSSNDDADIPCDTALSYQWSQVSPVSPLATISTPTQEITNIVLPNVSTAGFFEFVLVVTDEDGGTSDDPCTPADVEGSCGLRLWVLDTNP